MGAAHDHDLPVLLPVLLSAVLHGAALGGVAAAIVLTRARLHGWRVAEPWAVTAAWSLVGSIILVLLAVARMVA